MPLMGRCSKCLEEKPIHAPRERVKLTIGPDGNRLCARHARAAFEREHDGTSDTAATLEVSPKQRQRFDAVREECESVHVPPPSDDQMLKSLLDEWERDDKVFDHQLLPILRDLIRTASNAREKGDDEFADALDSFSEDIGDLLDTVETDPFVNTGEQDDE